MIIPQVVFTLFIILISSDGFLVTRSNFASGALRIRNHRLINPSQMVKYAPGSLAPPGGVDLSTNDDFWADAADLTLEQVAGVDAGDITRPSILVGEVQLEELEADTTTVTALKLLPDGQVAYLTSDGPPPDDLVGSWGCSAGLFGEDAFWLLLTRTFTNDKLGSTYRLSRVFEGGVEEQPGLTTAGGSVRVGENSVGYFTLLVVPGNVDEVRSSLKLAYPEGA